MRFRKHMELEHGLRQIDIAPLIDMVFQLLIFFMLTSSFVMQTGIKINLPKASSPETVRFENIEIIISRENVAYFNGRVVTTQELITHVKEIAKKKLPILIKADRHASLGRVVEIWDICRQAGISQINIATTQE
ncbi:MAG: biopolymer transporter ExbD [Candidatus Omnitrophica bacterium]|nr:biopolymer transporter ExbD [Candidatus Omnitrophota bacterium]